MTKPSRLAEVAGEEIRRRAARSSLLAFTKYTMASFQACWYHEVICRYLDRFVAGDIKRLMIFMPPRHGKSELVSRRLPAFILGKDPDASIIACTHTATLASDLNRDIQRCMDSDEYARLFPATRLFGKNIRTVADGTWLRNSDQFEVVGRRGVYRSAGIGQAIAGKGFDYGILDDLHASRESAESEAGRRAVLDFWNSDFYTRRATDAAGIVLCLTRWHMDDLAGHLLKQARENPSLPQWTVLRFPALAEDVDRDPEEIRKPGEALWPEKFSAESLLETRDACGSRDWASLYQQRPTPAGGVVFKRDFFRHFDADTDTNGEVMLTLRDPANPENVRYYSAEECTWFQTIDTAMTVSKHSAYTAVLTFCLTPLSDLCVWSVWRKKLEVPDQFEALMDLRERSEIRIGGIEQGEPWPKPLAFQGVEERASGHGLIQQAAARGCPFRRLAADRDKVSRASTAAVWYQNGKIWHKRAASWLTIFEDEMLCFPAGAHADMADCLSHGAIVANGNEFQRRQLDRPLLCWPAPPGSELDVACRSASPRIEPESIDAIVQRINAEMEADEADD